MSCMLAADGYGIRFPTRSRPFGQAYGREVPPTTHKLRINSDCFVGLALRTMLWFLMLG